MSLEAKIEELTGAVAALTAIVTSQVAIQERLAAGAQIALEKIEGGKAAAGAAEGKATRTRKPKEEAAPEPKAEKVEEPASTESGEAAAASASSDDEVPFADFAKKWLMGVKDLDPKDKTSKGYPEYQRRGKFLMQILGHFGVAKAPELPEEKHLAAKFYIERFKAGKEVDFDAAYDFTGAPDQEVGDDDDFGGFDD